MSRNPAAMADIAALAEVAKARRQNLVNLFGGTELCFGKMAALGGVADVASSAYSGAKSVQKLATTASKAAMLANPAEIAHNAQALLHSCTKIENLSTLKDVLGSDVVNHLIAEVTPYVGILSSGYSSCKKWYAVIDGAHTLYKYDDYRATALPGDPQAAVDAIQTIIKRNLARDTIDAARNTAALGAKIGGLFADFGTATSLAIGAANALASIVMTLISIGMDIKEMIEANEILADPSTLDLSVFEASPLLGCYLIACSDTSNVIAISMAEIGLPGWMDKVEKMKKKGFDTLISLAKKEITGSRLYLDGLKSDKGTHSDMGFLQRVAMEHETSRSAVQGAQKKFEAVKTSVSSAKDLVVGTVKQQFNDLVLSRLPSF